MTTLDAPPPPTETVTTTAFDLVDLPADAGRVALVRLDNGDPPGPAMRPTTFGPQSLVRQPPFEILLVNRGGREAATA